MSEYHFNEANILKFKIFFGDFKLFKNIHYNYNKNWFEFTSSKEKMKFINKLLKKLLKFIKIFYYTPRFSKNRFFNYKLFDKNKKIDEIEGEDEKMF